MKYLYSLLFGLLISSTVNAKSLDLTKTYTVCGHSIYPPISWTERGEVKGVGPYLVSKVFSQFGIKVSFQQDSNWQRCLRELEEGHIDIAAALYKTEQRKKYYQFLSTPIIKEPIVLFYNKNHPQRFLSRDDLKGKTMGVLFGDLFGDEADSWIKDNMRVEYVSIGEQNFGKLARGRIDIMPLGKYGGELQSKKMGYEKFITHMSKPLATDYWYIAISKKSPLIDYVPQFNDVLKNIKKQFDMGELMATFSHEYISSPKRRYE